MEVQVNELLQVGTYDLISVDKDDLLEVHGEKNVQEENLVTPNDPLLFALSPEPGRPLVRDEFILETILLCEVRDEFLERNLSICRLGFGCTNQESWRQKVLNEPELDCALRVFHDTKNHD